MISLRCYEEKVVSIAGKGKLLCQTMRVRVNNLYLQPDGIIRVSIYRYEGAAGSQRSMASPVRTSRRENDHGATRPTRKLRTQLSRNSMV